jgi:thymidine kinase
MANLHFHYGVMSAGKSQHLLSNHHDLTTSGKKVAVFKPALDNRFGDSEIKSRLGTSCVANSVKNIRAKNILTQFQDANFILVDEVQFFDAKSIDALVNIADNHGKIVHAYGLMIDSNGQMWPTIKKLLEALPELHKLETCCQISGCMAEATHILRFNDTGEIVRRGKKVEVGAQQYMSVCRKHFNEKYNGR